MAGIGRPLSRALLIFAALALIVGVGANDPGRTKDFAATTPGKLSEIKAHHETAKPKTALDDSAEGPSFSQIWTIREYFARCFGYALLTGIFLIITICCLTQPGCMVYDKFFDKGPVVRPDEEAAMGGGYMVAPTKA